MHRNDFVRQLNNPGGDRRPSRVLHLDIPLLLLLLTLCGIGLTVLYSASGQSIFYVKRQATFMLVGLFAMLLMAQFKPRFWERGSLLIYIGGLLSLIAVLFFGVGAKGAQRWLDLGFTRFQPSELMKIAVPMMVSAYLSKRYMPPRFKHVFVATLATLLPVFLVARQPDLGTSLIIFSSGFFAIFLAGLRKRYLSSHWPAGTGSYSDTVVLRATRLSKTARADTAQPRGRQTRRRLEYYSIDHCYRLWWLEWQRLDSGHSVTAELSPRESHGLYYCRAGRGIWLDRRAQSAAGLSITNRPLHGHRTECSNTI